MSPMTHTMIDRRPESPPAPRGRVPAGRAILLVALWAALIVLPGCKRYSDMAEAQPVSAQARPAQGLFLDQAGEPLDEAAVATRAAGSAYVLIGESHPSACDHAAQARIIELMAEAGAPPAVGLEMVSVDRQGVLDLFNKGVIDVDRLEADLDWGRSWGYPFEAYRPIFEAAKKHKLPLYALNAPRDVARKVGKSGMKSLSLQERLGLPAKIIPVSREQETSLREVFDTHPFGAVKDQEAAWKRFVTVQALWDTTMARRALEARVQTRRPVVVVAGIGHVERGWGIALRLRKFDASGKLLAVMPWRGGDKPDPAVAELFFHCPEVKRPRLGLTLEIADGRVAVTAVQEGSRADEAGIKAGDVIVKAQGAEVKVLKDLHAATVKAMGDHEPLRLDILRDGEPATLTVPLPAPEQAVPSLKEPESAPRP